MNKTITKTTLIMFLGLSTVLDACEGSSFRSSSAYSALENCDDVLDTQQIKELTAICQSPGLSKKEVFSSIATILQSMHKRGKSGYVLACKAGYENLADLIFEVAGAKDTEAQSALIAATQERMYRMVAAIVEKWSNAAHNYLGWAQEEAIAIAMNNNDIDTLDAVLMSTKSSIQFQILESEINAAYNSKKRKPLAKKVLSQCTPEQRAIIKSSAAAEKHYELVLHIARAKIYKPIVTRISASIDASPIEAIHHTTLITPITPITPIDTMHQNTPMSARSSWATSSESEDELLVLQDTTAAPMPSLLRTRRNHVPLSVVTPEIDSTPSSDIIPVLRLITPHDLQESSKSAI